MKLRFLLCLCIVGALAQSDYDEDDGAEDKKDPKEILDPRGHRPVSRGRETYSAGPAAPPPISGGSRYRGRPTAAPVGKLVLEKEEQPDSGGCNHMSEKMGVLCPTGCDLKKTLQKQERNVRPTVDQLKRSVDELTQSTNSVYGYVLDMTTEVAQRQRVSEGNGLLVGQYTDSLETQHAYIKDAVDITFPQNIKILQGVLDKIREKIQRLEKAITGQRAKCQVPCKVSCPIPVVSGKECEEIIRKGGEESQMYLIRPDPLGMPYKVFCDQTSKNGGWVLMQNRMDGSVDFGRRWDDYRRGFGNIAFDVGKGHCQTPGEYWLGNDRTSQLTKMGPSELLVEMEDWSGSKVYAQYEQFTVQGEATNYILAVGRYSGTAGNAFLDGATELFGENRTMTIHNGMMFSTYDRDNDKWIPGDSSKQCSREDGGGWWYNRCHSCNPNGRYYWGGSYTKYMAKHGTDDGIVWMNWKGSWYSLKSISMKIRPFFKQ
ncbi:fibrinogen beta chain [Sinocyclocheilus rhinocerous]|uniref:Fibrinogen beta chain n=1 Tax=Sinocyclocheilus rhinocerous TaxID=307959 RepID=A0A673HIV3_9TELE|nr:PREDICTED: fibrinogen beta chain-like [Sinocyclocheilus rhinocerous]